MKFAKCSILLKAKKVKRALTVLLCVAVFVTTFIFSNINVYAASVNVDTLSELVSACKTGGTVVVTSAIACDQTITIPKGVTVYLTCNHSAGSTTQDIYRAKGFHDHLFQVNDGATLYVRCCINGNCKDSDGNLRGTGADGSEGSGYYGRAMILTYGTVILDNDKSILKNNYNAYNQNYSAGKLWTYNSTSYYGVSEGYSGQTAMPGSAIFAVNGKVVMSNGQIYGCYADNGPAIYTCSGYSGDTVKISGGTIKNNVARRYGGAIFATSRQPHNDYDDSSGFVGSRTLNSTGSNALLTVSGGKICNNLSRLNSGAIWVGYGGTFYMSGGSIYNNVATEEGGGGIRCNAGTAGVYGGWMCFAEPGGQAWIAGGSIYNNSAATNGGGITVSSKNGDINDLKITGGSIYGNTAGKNGGGIYVPYKISVSGGKIYNNSAASYGGGIYLTSAASGKISGGNIYSNSAETHGGGVCSYGTLDVSGGYFYGNTNWGISFFGSDNTISGGRFGVSEYSSYSSYTPSRNTNGQIYIGSSADVEISGGSSRVISTLSGDEGTGANAGIRNYGSLTVSSTCNADNGYMDIYGTGSGIINNGTMKIAGKLNIMTSSRDGLGVQNRRGIYNSGTISVTGDLSIRYCGARAVYNTGTFTMSAGSIYGNESPTGSGGAIYNLGTFKITGGSIYNNTAYSNGGAVYNVSSEDSAGKFTMTGGSVYGNTAGSHGGGIYFTTAGQASTISGGKIYNNTATKYGGGVCSYRETGLTISNTASIYSNSGTHGGGVFNSTGTLTFSGTISSNTASYGGGAYIGSTINMTGGKFDGNTAKQKGGGIYSASSTTVKITGGVISNNHAKYYGGGAYSTGSLTLSNSASFNGNTTEQFGGGICNNSGTLTLSGGTITNNESGVEGGGVYSDGTITLSGVKITNNTAIHGAGVHIEAGSGKMTAGSISNNTSTNYGGGLFIEDGTFVFSSGSISNNSATSYLARGGGVYNDGTFTMTGGAINGNSVPFESEESNGIETYGGGLYNNGDYAIFNLQGGSIYDNSAMCGGGICVLGGSANCSGGKIYNNTAEVVGGGIQNWDTLNLTGVNIYSNVAPEGSGIYTQHTSTINMSEDAIVNKDNEIYLDGTSYITVPSAFNYDGLVAQVDCDHKDVGRIIAKSKYSNNLGSELLYYNGSSQRFKLTFDKTAAGEKAFLRGGDQGASSHPESGISDEDVFISTIYSISFDGNLSGYDVTVPDSVTKYWQEDLNNIPLTNATVGSNEFLFSGWNTTRAGLGEDYSSSLSFTDNKSIVLYAQWEKLNSDDDNATSYCFVRFVSKKYYKNSDGTYVSKDAGGLNYGSVWINIYEYEKLLTETLNNKQDSETGEWDKVYQTWTFTSDQIAEAKSYVEEHGLGKTKEANALTNFYNLFKPE